MLGPSFTKGARNVNEMVGELTGYSKTKRDACESGRPVFSVFAEANCLLEMIPAEAVPWSERKLL
jgi:hypothetical protein